MLSNECVIVRCEQVLHASWSPKWPLSSLLPHLQIAPQKEGSVLLAVHDLCLTVRSEARATVYISDAHTIVLWVVDKVSYILQTQTTHNATLFKYGVRCGVVLSMTWYFGGMAWEPPNIPHWFMCGIGCSYCAPESLVTALCRWSLVRGGGCILKYRRV